MQIDIRDMARRDWPAVAQIWQQGIETGRATFRTAVPTYRAWDRGHLRAARLVAQSGGEVAGWAALSPVYGVPAYSGLAELSLYVAAHCRGKGVGAALMAAVIDASEQNGIWTLESSIMSDNEASIALHRKFGFCEIGRRCKVAKDAEGLWRDTVLMDRRSALARYE